MLNNKLSGLVFILIFTCGCVTTSSTTKQSIAAPQPAKGKVFFFEDFNGTTLDKTTWPTTIETVGTVKVVKGNCVIDDTQSDGSDWTEIYSKEMDFPKKYEVTYRVKVTPNHAVGYTFYQAPDPNACCEVWVKVGGSTPPKIEMYKEIATNTLVEAIDTANPATDYVTVTLEVDGDKVKLKGGTVWVTLPKPPMKTLNFYGWKGLVGIAYLDWVKVTEVE